jgi:hypothetical protein
VGVECTQAMMRINVWVHGDSIHGEEADGGREVLIFTPTSYKIGGATDVQLKMAGKQLYLHVKPLAKAAIKEAPRDCYGRTRVFMCLQRAIKEIGLLCIFSMP